MNITKDELLKIGLQKRNKKIDLTWQEIADQYGGDFFADGETLRSWVKNQVHRKQADDKLNQEDKTNTYKETFEINKDGSQSSSRLVRLSSEQKKNPKYLLEAHGFDPDEWELVNAKASEWTGYSKQDGQFPQYASKITVKPKLNNFSFDMLEDWLKNVKPINTNIRINKSNIKDKKMLEIPLFDAHFGISDYEYYKTTQEKIFQKIASNQWEEILFIIGQDMIHNNDHRGRTANGTQIQVVDMERAWNDCRKFYEPLIESAINNSNRVKIIYSKGNHDESISWSFVKFLGALFPSVDIDDSFVERKAHVFGKNFIGITHGDKARRNLHNIFPIEFPLEWANATNREIHIGHLHTEDAKDVFGMVIRTLATRNRTDEWHKNMGFVGSHKRFMLFEYSEEALESIHYV